MRRVVIIILVFCCSFLFSREPAIRIMPQKPQFGDDDVLRIIGARLGEYYYGLYLNDKKAGYGKITVSLLPQEYTSDVVKIVTILSWTVKAGTIEKKIKITLDAAFYIKPPFRLHFYKSEILAGRNADSVILSRVKNGFRCRKRNDGVVTESEIEDPGYLLTDYWANEFWIPLVLPEKGNGISYTSFNPMNQGSKTVTSKVEEVREKKIDGVNTKLYRISHGDSGDEWESLYNERGVAYQFSYSSLLKLKLLPRDLAVSRNVPFDYVYDNMVRIKADRSLKEGTFPVTLALTGPTGIEFTDAPGQKVTYDTLRKNWVIRRIPLSEKEIPISMRDLQRCLGLSARFPVQAAEVTALLKKTGVNREHTAEQAEKLTGFVFKYLTDAVVLEEQTVVETIQRKRGDCTEHAELLVTLARAAGFPARTVSGLYYDENLKGYIGHMWAEIGIDEKWVPADPSFRRFPIDSRYIRFPADEEQALVNSRSLAKMKIELLK